MSTKVVKTVFLKTTFKISRIQKPVKILILMHCFLYFLVKNFNKYKTSTYYTLYKGTGQKSTGDTLARRHFNME